ncbi:MAG: DNRLRE domain-containing protein, partial [Chloroflexota bacterium]|nr:DNRLRE domain-containing protein [Chloroflexota bacterium]
MRFVVTMALLALMVFSTVGETVARHSSTVQTFRIGGSSIALAQGSVPPGAAVQISGDSFPANTTGTVYWGEEMMPVAMFATDSGGHMNSLVQVPEVGTGSYTLRAVAGGSIATTEVAVALHAARPSDKNADETATNESDAAEEETATAEPTSEPPTATDEPEPTSTTQPEATATTEPDPTDEPAPTRPVDTPTDEPEATATDTDDSGNQEQSDESATASPSMAADQTVELTPVADAYVLADSPETNFGAERILVTDQEPMSETYLRFSVANAPAVRKATLRLYVTNGSGTPSEIYAVSPEWDELTVTWDTKPAIISDRIAAVPASPVDAWVEFDVSSLIAGNGTYDLVVVNPHRDGLEY